VEILHGARPINEVLRDSEAPPRVKALLIEVDAIKTWGRDRGLKPTRNYDRYVDLHRPAAAWIVQACAPLSFEVHRWHFPIVGSVPYLGFFSQAEARRFADELAEREPLDVEVREADAFSTLGWFRDPVLSTMLTDGDAGLGSLVNTILHESVHATIYVRDQSAFNESLASFVADRLTPVFLEERRGSGAREASAWVTAQHTREARVARLRAAWLDLDGVYRSTATADEKRAQKQEILEALRSDLGMTRLLNNASLAGFKTYATGTEVFERLLSACEGSWSRFFAVLGRRAESGFAQPQQEALEGVLPDRCE
jgi:predicted aminopeptidase